MCAGRPQLRPCVLLGGTTHPFLVSLSVSVRRTTLSCLQAATSSSRHDVQQSLEAVLVLH